MFANFVALIGGAFCIALAAVMLATRAGYVFFVIGQRTVLFLAIIVATVALAFKFI